MYYQMVNQFKSDGIKICKWNHLKYICFVSLLKDGALNIQIYWFLRFLLIKNLSFQSDHMIAVGPTTTITWTGIHEDTESQNSWQSPSQDLFLTCYVCIFYIFQTHKYILPKLSSSYQPELLSSSCQEPWTTL